MNAVTNASNDAGISTGRFRVVVLPTDQLVPNDYNPNSLTDAEFAELVAEVRHLGRLPKPVVVRSDGDRWLIVDGEHGWRAAREVGLIDVPCEVVEADTFEAMRQTFKRNQHGTHNPVRLGQMFRAMLTMRGGLSMRALAEHASGAGCASAVERRASFTTALRISHFM